jgi:hypothetical protein
VANTAGLARLGSVSEPAETEFMRRLAPGGGAPGGGGDDGEIRMTRDGRRARRDPATGQWYVIDDE